MEGKIQSQRFDEQERAAIRRALIATMETHKIGVPRLAEDIRRADREKNRSIPLSTLQRFLRGTHRTSDEYVALISNFVKGTEQGKTSRFEEIARALSGTFDIGAPKDSALLARLGHRICILAYPDGTEHERLRSTDMVPFSEAAFWKPGRQSYLLVEETITVPGEGDEGDDCEDPVFKYEGVAVSAGADKLFIVTREAVTGKPRSAILINNPRRTPSRSYTFSAHVSWTPPALYTASRAEPVMHVLYGNIEGRLEPGEAPW